MNHIITVAMQIPMMTAGNAFLNFTPRSAAMSEPVHAPVPGSGIPTNNTSPQNSCDQKQDKRNWYNIPKNT